MTKDLNSNISLVEYNSLNLPSRIEFMDGSTTRYTYDATGRKLRAEYLKAGTQDTLRTDYCGNLIYEQGRPKMLLVDGGYVTFNDSLSFGEGWGGASYHYYLTDHLGNNRVVVNTNDSIEQVNHYYPYGGLMAESTGGDTQRYKYNGKELDRMHGLDWYDYGARWMNGLTFTTQDRFAEKYYETSPYMYCQGNPMKYMDVNGDSLTLHGTPEDIQAALDIYNSGVGNHHMVSVDDNGVVIISQTQETSTEDVSSKQTKFFKILYGIVNSENMTHISVVQNSSSVIIGDINSNTIDVADMMALDKFCNTSAEASMLHETLENSLVQDPAFRPNDAFRVTRAHGTAEAVEHDFTGNIGTSNVLLIDKNNSGFLQFIKDGQINESVKIKKGNINK